MESTFKAIQGSQAGAGFADSSTLDAGQKVESKVTTHKGMDFHSKIF